MKTIITVENKEVKIDGKIFVWFNDKFLSGWGGAAGRGYIIATDTEIFAEFSEFYPALKSAWVRDEKSRIWAIKADFVRGGFAVFSVVCVC